MYHPTRLVTLKEYYAKLMNRVVQWKEILANWQLGTKDDSDGSFRALQDLHDTTMRKGVKLEALVELLLARGIIRPEDLLEKQIELAVRLDQSLEVKFPGVKVTDSGIQVDEDVFEKTKSDLGFPL
jgi:hypothetical protein